MKIQYFALIIIFFSLDTFSQSRSERMLLSSLPQSLSTAMMENKASPSAESQAALDRIVQQDALNKKASREYFDSFKQTLNFNEFGIESNIDLQLYGYDFFSGVPYEYFGTNNVAITNDYILQSSDTFELVISGIGASSTAYKIGTGREGELNLPYVGSKKAIGMSLIELKKWVKEEFEEKIPAAEVSINLIRASMISSSITGEVLKQGSYSIQNSSSLTSLINFSGGIKKTGSLRQIRVRHVDGTSSKYDYYNFFQGKVGDFSIRGGDIINIPFAEKRIAVLGSVHRQAFYEFIDSDSIQDIINFAGGTKKEFNNSITIVSNSGSRVIDINDTNRNLDLEDGDIIFFNQDKKINENLLIIEGNVPSAGVYELSESKSLNNFLSYNDLRGADIYKGSAVISRRSSKSNSFYYLSIDISDPEKLKAISVQPGDKVIFLDQNIIRFLNSDQVKLAISGKVVRSENTNNLPIDKEMSEAGGLVSSNQLNVESASFGEISCDPLDDLFSISDSQVAIWYLSNHLPTMTVEYNECPSLLVNNPDLVSHLVKHSVFIHGEVTNKGIFPVSDGLKSNLLINMSNPIDITNSLISVRFSDGTFVDRNFSSTSLSYGATITVASKYHSSDDGYIEIIGEFTQPGRYKLIPNETLLGFLERVGGYKNSAYPLGAILTRESIKEKEDKAIAIARGEFKDNLSSALASGVFKDATAETIDAIVNFAYNLENVQGVGRLVTEFDLAKLRNTPSKNILLEPGDKIYMPRLQNTVSVNGQVLNPITVPYDYKLKLNDYINISGGMKDAADDSKIYVIQPNGIAIQKRAYFLRTEVMPGATIMVPRKSRPLSGLALVENLSPTIASLSVSLASIASINRN